ncbi:MAG: hypothetical protein ACE5JB_04010 [bacterium]
MKKHHNQEIHFVVCITDCEPDLERRKVYQVLPDESAAKDNYVRVIDESGEDYLYPASYFVTIELPKTAQESLILAS